MTKPTSLDAAMRQVLAARGSPVAPQGMGRADPVDGLEGALASPAGPEAYQIAVPPDFARDAALEAKARQWFHRAGLPQGAVSGIVQAYCRQLCCDPATLADGSQQRRTRAELAQEWGADYPRKVAAAQSLIEACGGAEELAEILGGTGLGDDAWLIRTLAAIAELDPKHGGER
ncbi:MAG: hypothetical protein IPK59_11960 [Rhodospirillaceae bacterium]|nr:hypothetical protein [Rhodospirillaceae bacterium]